MRIRTLWFPNRLDTNQAILSTEDGQKLEILYSSRRDIVLSM